MAYLRAMARLMATEAETVLVWAAAKLWRVRSMSMRGGTEDAEVVSRSMRSLEATGICPPYAMSICTVH